MNNIKKHLLTITILLFISHTNAQVFNAQAGKVERYILDDLFDEGMIPQQRYKEKKQIAKMNLLEIVPKKISQTKGTGNGSISGQLTDENGSPIEFQTIRLFEALSLTTPVGNTMTDAAGNYTIPNLTAGDYVLYSFGGGYLNYVWQSAASGGPQLCAGCVSTIDADNYITVAVDEMVAGIDISTRLGGAVSGYIKDVNSNLGVTTLTAVLYNVACSNYTTSTS
ncbi:MAG: carboxypeptidase-like regulatory domain-containing protein [Proteobacteria bacterium]|nr:carboxypeptidase-like regulatory domain-containing protein [Pseudomonadota bacterium]